ncbi:hypothetical protein HRI_002297600 [Hibiscus trionum]|uniref:DNA topoisomerase (ATP-hydrolyzing) n=1 Tax=Hibiscus trionum TaxID=183268 RepID=A0A9W7M3C6_HIBTR|nr:hypothetical protein HRI_002297600 [Hibiscus trionum]
MIKTLTLIWCVNAVLEDFFRTRLNLYVGRKKSMENALEQQISENEIKLKFIEHIADRKLNVHMENPRVLAYLEEAFPEATECNYDFLFSVTITDLMVEKFRELCSEKDKLKKQLEGLKGSTAESLWHKDLDEFLTELAVRIRFFVKSSACYT